MDFVFGASIGRSNDPKSREILSPIEPKCVTFVFSSFAFLMHSVHPSFRKISNFAVPTLAALYIFILTTQNRLHFSQTASSDGFQSKEKQVSA